MLECVRIVLDNSKGVLEMVFLENSIVELKQSVVDDIKKEIVAFANSEGGTLYIGIADNGEIVGVDDVDESSLQVSNMIRDSIKPDVTMFVNYLHEKMDGKQVIKVTVQRGTECPYYIGEKRLAPRGSICSPRIIFRSGIGKFH